MTVTASSNTLVSVDEVKRFLHAGNTITNNDEDDLVQELINQVSTLFENYTGKTFALTTHTEYFDGGVSELHPKNTPVTEITSINEDPEWLFTDDAISSLLYKIIEGGYSIYYNGIFQTGRDSVKLVYKAGYESIPEDLILAAKIQIGHLYRRRMNLHLDGETKAESTNTFTPMDLLPYVKNILNSYRGLHVT